MRMKNCRRTQEEELCRQGDAHEKLQADKLLLCQARGHQAREGLCKGHGHGCEQQGSAGHPGKHR